LRTVPAIFTVLVLSILAGCNGAAREKEPLAAGKELLTVNFQEGEVLRYEFVSRRDIEVDWEPTKSGAERDRKDKVDKSFESLRMILAYKPVKIDPYGFTTIEATCEYARVRRGPVRTQRAIREDPVESLAGKTFTLTVDATGKIGDYSQLDKLICEIGEKSFRPRIRRGRIKDPDMIRDFMASQWFLWDSISSIDKPSEGVSVGQSWKSILSIPVPMVFRKARDVTYRLDEIRESKKGRIAVIKSSYSPSTSIPRSWPVPYKGSFRVSGRFGFLKGYKLLDLQGEGEELFNIDAGRIEQYNQQYQAQFSASFPLGLGGNPRITIKQSLTMQFLGDR